MRTTSSIWQLHSGPVPQTLTKQDAHTVSCPVRDIVYIPIPGRTTKPMPALVTLQLPLSVRDGQEFKMDVEQHSGLTFRRTSGLQAPGEAASRGRYDYNVSTRKVLGAFRVTVAVKTGEPLLHKAVRNLAVLRYIYEAVPITDSWRLVFERYISQLSDKVSGLGVDPGLIKPSPDDPGVPGRGHDKKLECYTGKVCEVLFDCFGDFKGFMLESCEERHHFRSTEAAIGELILRACKERLWVSVCVREDRHKHICEIRVLSGPIQG
jgi:hypothetical protein